MKKIFTVYGNCQSTILAACLQQIKSFKDNFQYYRLPFCHRITSEQYNTLLTKIDGVDLILTQPVSCQFRGGGFDSQSLSKLAKTSISFPSLQFYGYFPSLTRFKMPKLTEQLTTKVTTLLAPYAPLTRDSLYHYNDIRMMIAENYSTSLICQYFDSGSRQETSIESCKSWSLSYLKEKELKHDLIPISDYIECHWQKKFLFYTPRHPSGFVMAELVRRICDKLNLPVLEHELDKIRCKDHFSHIRLYIPQWIRNNYLSDITELANEKFFSMTAVDTVSLYSNLYHLIPTALDA